MRKHDLSHKLIEIQASLTPEWMDHGITRLALFFKPRCNYTK